MAKKSVWLPQSLLWLPHQPWAAHTKPVAPIGQEFERRGWRAVLLSPEKSSQRAAALRFRLPFEPAGDAWNTDPAVEEQLSRVFMEQGNEAFNDVLYGKYFSGMAVSMAKDLERLAAEDPPDLIIRDCSEWGSALFAEKHGIPCVPFDNGLSKNIVDHWGVIQPTLARAREELGMDQRPDEAPGMFDTTLWTPAPPELLLGALPIPDLRGFQREFATEVGSGVPEGVFQGRGYDIVISPGSSGREAPGMAEMFETRVASAIEAANQLGYPALAAVGNENVDRFRAIAGPNVHVEGWIDQNSAVEQADLLIAHGGAGGTTEAIRGGTPIVGIPGFADQPENVAAIERNGLGLGFLDWRSGTPEAIAEKVETILANRGTFQEAIERMQQRITELPPLVEVVGGIIVDGPIADPTGPAIIPPQTHPITIKGPSGFPAPEVDDPALDDHPGAENPGDTSITNTLGEENPADPAVEEDPAGNPVEDTSVDGNPDDGPVDGNPVDEDPDDGPVDDNPGGGNPVDEDPDDGPVEETSAKHPLEENPVQSPVEETPVEEPVEETPVEETPVDDPVEETPVEEPVEETPVEETPVEEPVEETPVDETPVEEPVEETPVDETPVEETPVTAGVFGKPGRGLFGGM